MTVTPIPKANKDNSVITNWRPVSQIPCISKIFEKVLAIRVNATLQNINILNSQYRFLRGISTEHLLAKFQTDIDAGLNIGKATSIVSLDLRAAFDVVWHNGLIYKLNQLKFPVLIIKTIYGLLKQRSFAVRLNGEISNIHEMPSGVPQGSVFSPIAFNIYMYDIPKTNDIDLLQYADDISVKITHYTLPR